MVNQKILEGFYRPYCNEEEIRRIFNVKTTDDYLLKIRADTVADQMRIFRVIRARALKNKAEWNFTEHFSTLEFNDYLKRLEGDEKRKVSSLTKGFVFSNEPNGACMRSPHGDLIIVSESLRYFLYYMNMHFLNLGNEEHKIPDDVRHASLIIAIRTMLKTETLDFELDPRGIIPDDLDKENKKIVKRQLEFIIGHEYAHYLLNHLDERKIVEMPLFRILPEEEAAQADTYKFYNHYQKQEFEADKGAFTFAHFDENELDEYVWASLLFFIYLDIYRSVSDVVFPPMNIVQSHPDPIDRMWNLFNTFEERVTIPKQYIENLLRKTKLLKEFLQEDVSYNIEKYECYGSIYLGKWRGPALRDRIDY